MIREMIMYAHCVVGFACASVFVEGAALVKKYDLNNSSVAANEHTVTNVDLTAGEKLIVAFAFETDNYGWRNSTVALDVGGTGYNFVEVVTSEVGRFSGLYYLDVSSSITNSGALGTIKIDLGE